MLEVVFSTLGGGIGTASATFSIRGVPSTGQKLNLSANSSRQVEHCFIFILARPLSAVALAGLALKQALLKSLMGSRHFDPSNVNRTRLYYSFALGRYN